MNILDFCDVLEDLNHTDLAKLSNDYLDFVMEECSAIVKYCEEELEMRHKRYNHD